MNVVVVARTRMSGRARCIGGLAENGRSLRLLTPSGGNHDDSSPFMVGQVWDLSLSPRERVIEPHVEDVIVRKQRFVRDQSNLGAYLARIAQPWKGGIEQLFDRRVGYTASHNGYVCKRLGIPDRSTGFWVPDGDLILRGDGQHFDYVKGGFPKGLKHVGEGDPPKQIPSGTLVRVSLARWWRPEDADPEFEERCYLQLSGWYD